MEDGRRMLELAIGADRGRLAEALDGRARDAEGRDRPLGKQLAKLFPHLDKFCQVLDIGSSERVLTTATAAARFVGGTTARPPSISVSSRMVTILRMSAVIAARPRP